MNIYNRLNQDIQEQVDKCVWEKTKQPIPEIELIHRKLRLLWQEYTYDWENSQRLVMDHFCEYILKPRVYGRGYCGFNTASGKYEYIIDKEKNKCYSLGKYIIGYCNYLEKKNKKPSFEKILDECRLGIDNWVNCFIIDNDMFQYWAEKLGFNILDMFEIYYDNFGDNPFENENYQKMIFTYYYQDYVERILLITYNWDIEDLNSETEDATSITSMSDPDSE